MDGPRGDGHGDAAQRQRIASLLRDPHGYFEQARREARENAKRTVDRQLDTD